MAIARESNIMADVALLPYVVVVRAYPCVRESSVNACNEEESDANGRSTVEVNGAWWGGFCVAIISFFAPREQLPPMFCETADRDCKRVRCIVQTSLCQYHFGGRIYNL
jgi:hypothetical protein